MGDATAGGDSLRVRSAYTDALERHRAELLATLADAVDDVVVDAAHRAAARASVRLDASPLTDVTAAAVDRGQGPAMVAAIDRDRGWAAALRLEGMPTQEIAAAEYRGVRAAQAHEHRLAAQWFDAPVATVAELHRTIAEGLVATDRLGALRTTTRAVLDGAQGMVVFQSPAPERLPGLLEALGAWVSGPGRRESPFAVAALVHARLLHWQPFEAGNGRVARAASRVALRAAGGDPWGLAVPEREYARDPLGYLREIAATVRRRDDLRPWVERIGQAVVVDLEHTARAVGVGPRRHDDDEPVRRMCGALSSDDTVTIRELADAVDGDRMRAWAAAGRLCWSGSLQREVAARGLRYVRTSVPVDRA